MLFMYQECSMALDFFYQVLDLCKILSFPTLCFELCPCCWSRGEAAQPLPICDALDTQGVSKANG